MISKLTRSLSCPNLTGKVAGDIIFDIKSVVNVNTASAIDRTQFTNEEVGKMIGQGSTATVYQLKNYTQHVIKILGSETPNPSYVTELKDQCESWNLMHGGKTATTPTLDGKVTLVMPKINGVELIGLHWRSVPDDLDNLVTACLQFAWSKGIIPDDPNLGNFLYDAVTHKVTLVDITPIAKPTQARFNSILERTLEKVYTLY